MQERVTLTAQTLPTPVVTKYHFNTRLIHSLP